MKEPYWIDRAAVENIRGERGFAWEEPGFWGAGSLEGLRRPSVAIVGTRAATAYGRRIARSFASALGAAGCCIVSGLALGIDAAAHDGALEVGAPTIGVLGSGHRCFFPRRNEPLGQRMVGDGAVISPFPPDRQAQPWQFLARNALVAALVDAVVVIEAPARSGALNTASWAAVRIPVFAVPGDIDRAHVQGCHALIRDGATLARSAEDVLEQLRIATPVATAQPHGATPLESAVLASLESGEANLDAIATATHANGAEILATLAMLELRGLVESAHGRFARRLP